MSASVSLHPLASRDGQQSSTIVSVQVQPTETSAVAQDHAATPRGCGGEGGAASYASLASEPQPQQEVSRTWGIEHKNMDDYFVIDEQPALCTCVEEDGRPHVYTVADSPPIRAMTPAQFADLWHKYNALDVPHSTMFPFLHGVDGSNPAQNTFFRAPLSGQPFPNYRGLTVVRADMPTPSQQAQVERQRKCRLSSASKRNAPAHSRGSSAAASASSCGIASRRSSDDDGDNGDDDDYDVDVDADAPGMQSSQSSSDSCPRMGFTTNASASSASISSSMASGDSLFSDSMMDESRSESQTSMSTSYASSPANGSACGGGGGAGTNGTNKLAHGASRTSRTSRASPPSYDPQPDKCLLNSSLYPYEIIRPPVMLNKGNRTAFHIPTTYAKQRDHVLWQTAEFSSPPQAPGVNLRNFKIQAAKYSSVSDIVVYCPTGFHAGVLTIARWLREAQETCWAERQERGLGGLRYNVFVVIEPFDVFERDFPALVSVDSQGNSRHRIDFVDREREEMQRLTAASPIDDNVWLGSSADVPGLSCLSDDGMSSTMTDEASTMHEAASNPNNFALCIECHDAAEVPDASKLGQAAHYLDMVDTASSLNKANSHLSLRDLERESCGRGKGERLRQRSCSGSSSSEGDDGCYSSSSYPAGVSLGPNGWTPNPHKTQSRRNKTTDAILDTDLGSISDIPAANRVVHLECSSVSGLSEDVQMSRAICDLTNLCAWIKSQAQPSKASSSSSSSSAAAHQHGQAHGILAGALRYSRNNGLVPRKGSSSHHHNNTAAKRQQPPRRILLHCGDGYTETSILALAYLMYARGLSLPEAYLDLQNRAQRSFFVYARDLPFLKKLEQHIKMARKDSEHAELDAQRPPRSKHSFPWLSSEEREGRRRNGSTGPHRRDSASSSSHQDAAAGEPSVWARGLAGLVSAAAKKPVTDSSSSSASPPSRALTPTPASVRALSAPQTPLGEAAANNNSHAWFSDARFEGAFPSRILPFLYLGNLNHALNPAMLHALGITHVVSVGESALHPPAAAAAAVFGASNEAPIRDLPSVPEPEVANSLWHEEQRGRISVLDLKNVSDDGIDPLRATMRHAVEYIEQARRAGGKVLVHCRVGVSRSTTIVLAYVMAHLDMGLIESYLLVRSRRLSILIQPHLLFFWELRGWETYVASQKLKQRIARKKSQSRRRSSEGDHGRMSQALADYQFSLASLSLNGSSPTPSQVLQQISAVGASCGFDGAPADGGDGAASSGLDVDIGAGAGTPYGFHVKDVLNQPFGAGSPSRIGADALRPNWGYLCREIAALNERYF